MAKRLIISILLLFSGILLTAQTTKVKGRVTDKETGEPIPFAAVFLEGTTIGVSTDLEGYYAFETRDLTSSILTASLLGYEPASFAIVPGSFSEVNFKLLMTDNRLNAAVVKPDNRYMRSILKKIDAARDRNNPEKYEAYFCDTYTKVELDMVNPRNALTKVLIPKKLQFVYDYADTSVVSGQPYLPSMIAESIAERYRSHDPDKSGEIIRSSRISGLNPTNTLKQYTGSMPMRVNFYNPFINAFDVEFPSPIAQAGTMYYNYFLIDSLSVDARKTYRIRFHPKKAISSAAFDGEMLIDAQDWALREMHAKMQKDGKVNWLRDIVIDVENQRLGDSLWFYRNEKMYADFSVTLRDSSKMMSFLGRREIAYSTPLLGAEARTRIDSTEKAGDFKSYVAKDAGFKDDQWWEQARPIALSPKEKGIYEMIDSVQTTPFYKGMYGLFNMLATGYWETKYVGFGTYQRLISFGGDDGVRLRLGARTTRDLSRKVRAMAYVAYGFGDKRFNGGGTFEYMVNNQPFRKLTVNFNKDNVQLGAGNAVISNSSDLFKSLLGRPGGRKYSPALQGSISYSHEFTEGFTGAIALEHMTYYSNKYVPMVTPGGDVLNSISMNRLHLQARLSWGETFTRGIFEKHNSYSKFPIVTFDVIGAIKGITPNDYTFLRTEATMNWKLRMPPLGAAKVRLNGGHIQGNVPYPLLKLHEGNNSYYLDGNSFSCMDSYEFASDSWVTLFYEHNFGGWLLRKIPLIKKLELQEVFVFRTAYGVISDRNKEKTMLFPEGMKELKYPYMEVGVGITNIFRLLRVDTVWRLTHHEGHKRNFAVNVGLEVKF